MSTASSHSRLPNKRISSLQHRERRNRSVSRMRPRMVDNNDAYSFALRVAFLHHLLQPRAKRKQYVQPPKAVVRTSTAASIGDLMKDFSGLGSSSKNTKFPHAFMSELERGMQGILMGRTPGYNDPAVKRTFAEAYTAFTEQGFRKRMDKERRIEDLVLIFYSNATKSAQKSHSTDDPSWKGMVDNHVALFVRLLINTLRENGHEKDKADLIKNLATLESKLLTNDQELFVNTGVGDGSPSTIEVVAPLSYAVKDMQMVQVVAKIFGLSISQVQGDIDANKSIWTEEAALEDLKAYQHCINVSSNRTLQSDDFDLEEAYQAWKKAEAPDLSQMILEIIRAKPEISKKPALNKALPPISPTSNESYPDIARNLSSPIDGKSPFDITSEMRTISLVDDSPKIHLEERTFTFTPPDPRAFFRAILVNAMTFDQLHADVTDLQAPPPLLSNQSIDLMNELCYRWRIPQISKLVILLEIASQKFMDQEIGLEELDTAFDMVKNPPDFQKRGLHSPNVNVMSLDRSMWIIQDFALYRHTLNAIHDALLRDLYDRLLHCYDPKPPSPAPILVILESHVYSDPSFHRSEEDEHMFTETLTTGLQQKAAEVYRGYLEAEVPQVQQEWQFYHVVKLGQAVVKLCERIRKRYRKNPEIMGVNLLNILVETMLPSFEQDASELIKAILQVAQASGEEVDLEDGFDLYRELVEIRRIHRDILPTVPFAFHIEGVLNDFVWRWIKTADEKMVELVDQAIAQDDFQVRTQHPENIPTDDERHSHSVIDMFRLFNQTADQVFKLNWDDDVQYAKFMTALARSFGIGLGRYCEVLEQKFAKEMDRLSPAQEAQTARSTQEKWMQMAKDVLTSKEKIEPFQFYPESFVKLNNVEFALQQLDKLEKIMNVDACAEVLAKATPVEKQRRRPTKYVFTIKIVEAEELKACDPSGTSDPYVVLGDEYQKRLAKTRVVMRNLNPRWDESVDITVQGPLNIIATVWDYDTFGDHDYVGRTSLKLDPNHFSDYMPREYWLSLDTQGRILFRVSMEGERDDIQFYFGKAFRMLKRTERDMTRKITDKLSTFINASLSRETLRSLTTRSISVASVTSLWKNRHSISATPVTTFDKESVLKPLFTYFDENFAIMKQTLTDASMIMVMTRLWKEVLMALESLMVPPLSDKPSTQRPLTQQEVDIVYFWLQLLFEFFNAKDEETGEVMGVPEDVLRSPKYSDLASLNFFYFEQTDDLIRISERMATANAQRAQAQRNRLSAPASLGAPLAGGSGLIGVTSMRRAKSIMLSRNLGTMKKAKEEKRKEAQADPSDDMILRILRMRPEAGPYLRDRSRQKERLAAAAAAEMIVRQSLAAGGNRFGSNNLPRR